MSGDILALALNFGARLKRSGGEYSGPCPRCGGRDRFSVNVRKQLFNCRGCGVGGDAIALARHLRGCSYVEAASLIGREARQRPSKPAKGYDAAESVARILSGLQPVLGAPGEAYLRTRGIDVEEVEDLLCRADAVGWNPSVYFHEPGHPLHGRRLGCIVAILTDPITARPTGSISRTYIDRDLKKVGPAKSLDGARGIVRLSPDADVGQRLNIGEGIETCLAAASRWDNLKPIWSCGSAATLSRFPVLAGIEHLTIICDHDENGAGERAARELADRWLEDGREVRIIKPKTKGEDLSDIVKRRSGARTKPTPNIASASPTLGGIRDPGRRTRQAARSPEGEGAPDRRSGR
jgi:hypothetical protein